MKTLSILLLALLALPASLLAGIERERSSLPHPAEVGLPAPMHLEARAMENQLSALPETEEAPRVELQSAKAEIAKTAKATVKRPAKPHRPAWARTGTIILLVSAGVFFLGLIFLVVGLASFYGFGLILLGEIFLLLSSIGLTVGLIVGAVG